MSLSEVVRGSMTCPHLFVTNVIEDNYSDISSQFGVGGGTSRGEGLRRRS